MAWCVAETSAEHPACPWKKCVGGFHHLWGLLWSRCLLLQQVSHLLCVLLPLSGCPRLHSKILSVLSRFICSGLSLTQRAAACKMGTRSFSPCCSASAFQSNTAYGNCEQHRPIQSSNFQGSMYQFIIPTEHLAWGFKWSWRIIFTIHLSQIPSSLS